MFLLYIYFSNSIILFLFFLYYENQIFRIPKCQNLYVDDKGPGFSEIVFNAEGKNESEMNPSNPGLTVNNFATDPRATPGTSFTLLMPCSFIWKMKVP